ncbi:hypothetical protein GCM10011521_24450 [Arenimonas soli]|uniref:Glycosyltransferase RgtA/B/C/D-like domain-containing protein n=1 Tax=Arenimonas soli TaxID=2269504 RepID=A0ABQ1HPB2_9GAMM|nr:hypothetical protein [Arenimonas soli]GGA85117.1 hypothetical protein GCM10011521_24450 [Arenimonas soli]
MTPKSYASALFPLALAVLTLLAFWPGLTGGFMFDDFSNIVRDEMVHAETIDLDSLQRAAKAYPGPPGRPLATMSLAVDYSLWGLNPWGFKLTNLFLHVLNALLVFALLRRLLPLSNAPARWGAAAAFAIATFWAIHPLQVSTVMYVVQRMEMLSLTFVLLALLAYLRGRRNQIAGQSGWLWLSASAALALVGLFAKETAVLFPAYALALELTVLQFRASQPRTTRLLRLAFATGVAVAVALFVFWVIPKYASAEAYNIRDFSLAERLMTQLRVLPMYLGWIVLPTPSSYVFYYDSYQVSKGWLDPATTLVGGLFMTALVAAAFALRRRLPMVSLGLFWFLAAHLLTSNVFPLELVYEHRNHFALLGVLLAIAELVRRLPESDVPRVRQIAVVLLIVGLSGLTLIRSATWGNSLNLSMALVQKNPDSSRASMDLGEHYMLLAGNDPTSPFYAKGVQEFERGSRVPDASPMPEQGLIVYAALAGQPTQQAWWDRVVHKLKTRAIGPQEIGMIVDLLRMRHEGVEFDDARFADAYLVLVNRIDMPATQYYAFAEHALKFLGDEQLASGLLQLVVDKSLDEPEFIRDVIESLEREGYGMTARMVAGYAREIGLVDVPLPPLPEATTVPAEEAQ